MIICDRCETKIGTSITPYTFAIYHHSVIKCGPKIDLCNNCLGEMIKMIEQFIEPLPKEYKGESHS